jgi:hypothetical protein
LMMIGPVPEDVMVIGFDERVFSETVPKDALVGFVVNRRVPAHAGIDIDKSRSISATEVDEMSLGFTVAGVVILVVAFEADFPTELDRTTAKWNELFLSL